MLPALGSVEELATRVGRPLHDSDIPTAQAALSDASTLVRSEVGQTWVDANDELEAVPDVAVMVTLSCARRAFLGETFRGTDLDGTTFVESPVGRPLYLSRAEKDALRVLAGNSGVYTISSTRHDVSTEDVWVPVAGSDAMFPFIASEDGIA